MTQSIYLVTSRKTGETVTVFAERPDAESFARAYNEQLRGKDEVGVMMRTLYYGQPSKLGYNL